MNLKELARAMNVSQEEYPSFGRMVKKLIAEGSLVMLKRGRIGQADQLDMAVGTISINRSGRGFLEIEGVEQDIMIVDAGLHTALDGDRAMVKLLGERSGRPSGAVVKVLERSDRNIVGVVHKKDELLFVHPDNPRIHRDISVARHDSLHAQEGEKVVVKLTSWDDPHTNPYGRITERIGRPTAPGVDMLAIIKSHDLPEGFSDEVISQAEKAAAMDTGREMAKANNRPFNAFPYPVRSSTTATFRHREPN